LCVGISHSKSVVTVQREFRANYAKDPTTDKTIRVWYKQFTETGYLCKQKAPMLTCVCGKNLNILSLCAVSPVVNKSKTSSCQKKKKSFQFSRGCEKFH